MLRKFLAYLLIISLLLPAIPVQAEGIYKMVGSGAVTLANMRISAVAGTAFIDFSDSEAAANKLIDHKGYLLKVRDSSNRAIQGYVKEAGTGETLGSNLITNSDFEINISGWSNSATEVLDTFERNTTSPLEGTADLRIACTSAGYHTCGFQYASFLTNKALYKQTCVGKEIVGQLRTEGLRSANTAGGVLNINYLPTKSTTTFYETATRDDTKWFIAYLSGVSEANIDNPFVGQVLTPSATGVTITSTKGGSTFNFAALDSAFNYADASGYTYELWQVNNAVEVASGSIAANEMLADTTATNAFVAPVGVDLSAYQTGKYIFAAYNTVGGYAAFGYIKGTAPGVETLDVEQVTNGNFTAGDTGWIKGTGWTIVDQGGGDYEAVATNASLANIYQADVNTLGALYKLSIECTDITAGTYFLRLGAEYYPEAPFSTAGVKTGYINNRVANTDIFLRAYSPNLTARFDDYTVKRVTDCAATGALIVSAKDGATRAFAYKHASFNPNIASTYKLYYVGD